MNKGNTSRAECLIHELIPVFAVGPLVAAVIEFRGDQGLQRLRLTEPEVNMVLAHAVARRRIAPVGFEDVGLPDFHQDVGAEAGGGAEDLPEV